MLAQVWFIMAFNSLRPSDTYIHQLTRRADLIRLTAHYTISLSSLCKFIWRHLINKIPVWYILSSVWVRLSIFSQLSIIQYVGLCVFSLHISVVMIEIICIICLIIIIKLEIWTITHCLRLGHETVVCAVCPSISPWVQIMICCLVGAKQWSELILE